MLRVSKLTDYATVILSFLAAEASPMISAAQIAKNVHLSFPTVSKILKILSEAELVIAFRGSNGGYQLARNANTITVADVVMAIEGQLAMTACCLSDTSCTIDSLCAIKDNWKMINKIILTTLARLTLQDMMQPLSHHAISLKGIPVEVKGLA